MPDDADNDPDEVQELADFAELDAAIRLTPLPISSLQIDGGLLPPAPVPCIPATPLCDKAKRHERVAKLLDSEGADGLARLVNRLTFGAPLRHNMSFKFGQPDSSGPHTKVGDALDEPLKLFLDACPMRTVAALPECEEAAGTGAPAAIPKRALAVADGDGASEKRLRLLAKALRAEQGNSVPLNITPMAFIQSLAEAETDSENCELGADNFWCRVSLSAGGSPEPLLNVRAIRELEHVILSGTEDIPSGAVERLAVWLERPLYILQNYRDHVIHNQTSHPKEIMFDLLALIGKSAALRLRMNTVYTTEKWLNNEDLVVRVLDFLAILNEELSSPSSQLDPCFNTLEACAASCTDILHLLSTSIAKYELSEVAAVKAYYVSLDLVFPSVRGERQIKPLSWRMLLSQRAVDFAGVIFRCFPDLRSSLVDEIVDRMLVADYIDAQMLCRLSNGDSIQLYAYVVMAFIHGSISLENLQVGNASPVSDSSAAAANGKKIGYPYYSLAQATSAQISRSLLIVATQTNKMYETKDSLARDVLVTIMGAMAAYVGNPDFPAAFMFLKTCLHDCISATDDTSISASATLFLINLLTNCVLDLKRIEKSLGPKTPETSFVEEYTQEKLGQVVKSFSTRQNASQAEGVLSSEILKECASNIIKAINLKVPQIKFARAYISAIRLDDSDKEIYARLVIVSPFTGLMAAALSKIVKFLDSEQVTVRTKALRSLKSISHEDSTIFEIPTVISGMDALLSDSSAQVREVTLDCVAQLVNGATAGKILQLVLNHFDDTAVTVRKRCLRILAEMYPLIGSTASQSSILRKIVLLSQDEESSVSEMALSLFAELFYSKSLDEPVQSKCVVYEKITRSSSEEIVAFQEATARILHSRGLFDYAATAYKQMLDHMMTRLCEPDSIEEPVALAKLAEDILNFSKADPLKMSSGQLINLIPELNMENAKECPRLYFALVRLFNLAMESGLPFGSSSLRSMLQMTSSALVSINRPYLEATVRFTCLCLKLDRNPEKLARIVGSILSSIKALSGELQFEVAEAPKLSRLLLIIGYFAQYGNLDEHDLSIQNHYPHEGSSCVQCTISMLAHLTDNPEPLISATAVKAIGHCCLSKPALFLGKTVLQCLDKEEARDIDGCRGVLISVLKAMLTAEKNRSHDNSESHRSVKRYGITGGNLTEALHGQSSSQHDDGVAMVLIQRFFPYILRLTARKSRAAVEILEMAIEMGLANPRLCIGEILFLENATDEWLAKKATKIHSAIQNRYESLLDGAYHDGIRCMYDLLAKDRSHGVESMSHCLLQPAYNVVCGSRASRRKFVQGLVRCVSAELKDTAKVGASAFEYSRFMCQNMASLAYSAVEDVLAIIYQCRQVVSWTGVAIGERLESDDFDDGVQATAAVVVMLLTLSEHLQEAYGLSELRCRNYDPRRHTRDTNTARRKGPQEHPMVSFAEATAIYNLDDNEELVEMYMKLVDAFTENTTAMSD